jgi:hypothetical protein
MAIRYYHSALCHQCVADFYVGPCVYQIVAIDGRQDLLNVANADSMLNGRYFF